MSVRGQMDERLRKIVLQVGGCSSFGVEDSLRGGGQIFRTRDLKIEARYGEVSPRKGEVVESGPYGPHVEMCSQRKRRDRSTYGIFGRCP